MAEPSIFPKRPGSCIGDAGYWRPFPRTSTGVRFLPGEVSPGLYVAMDVQDSGCGMDEMTMSKTFDPFLPRNSRVAVRDLRRCKASCAGIGAQSGFIAFPAMEAPSGCCFRLRAQQEGQERFW